MRVDELTSRRVFEKAWLPGRPPRRLDDSTTRLLVLALIASFLAQPAFACAVCYGAPGDPMTEGMNRGIWVLLGIVFVVQVGFVALFWSFWRRAREQRRFRESLRVIEGGSHS